MFARSALETKCGQTAGEPAGLPSEATPLPPPQLRQAGEKNKRNELRGCKCFNYFNPYSNKIIKVMNIDKVKLTAAE